MNGLDKQRKQAIERNFSAVVNFLDRKLRKTSIQLVETPCYFYTGEKSKLEVTVFSNPRIGTVDVRMIKLKNFDRDPYFENSYELDGLYLPAFEKEIEDLIAQIS